MDFWHVCAGAGIAIGSIAYVPQIVHLAKDHCSAGVSLQAWSLWATAAVLIGLQAIRTGDVIFIGLQVVSLSASIAILVLGWRFRGMTCSIHRQWHQD